MNKKQCPNGAEIVAEFSETCQRCRGEGVGHVLAGGKFREVPCDACDGRGKVTPEHAERLQRGLKLREDRIHRSRSLRAEAAWRGISPTTLSLMEQGKIQPCE